MVWYLEVDDVVCANIEVLDLTNNRHPHKLLGSRRGIQIIIDKVKNREESGLTCPAAILMKELARSHLFAGANHRTAYVVAKMFLIRNGRRLRVDSLKDAYRARKVQELGRFLFEKTESMDFMQPAPSLVRSDSLELRKRILELTHKEATKVGISKSTLHYLHRYASSNGSFKVYQKVADRLRLSPIC